MYEVIQVKLREAGRISYFSTSGLRPSVGNYVIVQADRGLDYGMVISAPEILLDAEVEKPLRNIIREAMAADLSQIEKNKEKIKEVVNALSPRGVKFKIGSIAFTIFLLIYDQNSQ